MTIFEQLGDMKGKTTTSYIAHSSMSPVPRHTTLRTDDPMARRRYWSECPPRRNPWWTGKTARRTCRDRRCGRFAPDEACLSRPGVEWAPCRIPEIAAACPGKRCSPSSLNSIQPRPLGWYPGRANKLRGTTPRASSHRTIPSDHSIRSDRSSGKNRSGFPIH